MEPRLICSRLPVRNFVGKQNHIQIIHFYFYYYLFLFGRFFVTFLLGVGPFCMTWNCTPSVRTPTTDPIARLIKMKWNRLMTDEQKNAKRESAWKYSDSRSVGVWYVVLEDNAKRISSFDHKCEGVGTWTCSANSNANGQFRIAIPIGNFEFTH